MTSPFEELEYLVDYLPAEGEAVVVRRRGGELVCEAFQRDARPGSPLEPELYGRLVQANERLAACATLPVWACVLVFFWSCVAIHYAAGLGWQGWVYDACLATTLMPICIFWIRRRQRILFRTQVWPMFDWQVRRRGVDRFAILGLMRQHNELNTLANELSRSID